MLLRVRQIAHHAQQQHMDAQQLPELLFQEQERQEQQPQPPTYTPSSIAPSGMTVLAVSNGASAPEIIGKNFSHTADTAGRQGRG